MTQNKPVTQSCLRTHKNNNMVITTSLSPYAWEFHNNHSVSHEPCFLPSETTAQTHNQNCPSSQWKPIQSKFLLHRILSPNCSTHSKTLSYETFIPCSYSSHMFIPFKVPSQGPNSSQLQVCTWSWTSKHWQMEWYLCYWLCTHTLRAIKQNSAGAPEWHAACCRSWIHCLLLHCHRLLSSNDKSQQKPHDCHFITLPPSKSKQACSPSKETSRDFCTSALPWGNCYSLMRYTYTTHTCTHAHTHACMHPLAQGSCIEVWLPVLHLWIWEVMGPGRLWTD